MLVNESVQAADLTARLARTVTRFTKTLASCAIAAAMLPALAQGGPPMVTDDPETPGDGHWEINIGAIATRTPGRWEVAAPDADINYGWGDRIQLKLDIPWVTARDDGERWKSGGGEAEVGVKWRFVDQEQAGFSLSTYPQYGRSLMKSSVRRGLAADGHRFFLPLEFAADVAGFGVAAEIGREFVQRGPNAWQAGVVAAHPCGGALECVAEIHTTQAPGEHQTLLNLGLHWKLDDALTVLAAVGRDVAGVRSEERRQALAYLGLQITR